MRCNNSTLAILIAVEEDEATLKIVGALNYGFQNPLAYRSVASDRMHGQWIRGSCSGPPGLYWAGDTREETKQLIREAVVLHLKTMQDDGDPIPEPTTAVEYVPAVCS